MGAWITAKLALGFTIDPGEFNYDQVYLLSKEYPIDYSFSGTVDYPSYWVVHISSPHSDELQLFSYEEMKAEFNPDNLTVQTRIELLKEILQKLGLSDRFIGPILFANYG